jgi:outer membrane protein assembly factor BamB
MCVRGFIMRIIWKRRDIFAVVLAFAMLFCILLPVLGAPSGPSIFRYDDKKTGISNMVSNIVAPEARWTFESGAAHGSVPMAGDIDSDGKMEVVWSSSQGILYALDENGQIEWTYEATGPLYAPSALGDLDGDGIMEVVCGGYYNGAGGDANLYALNGEDGSLLWTFSTMGEGSSFEKGFEAAPLAREITIFML